MKIDTSGSHRIGGVMRAFLFAILCATTLSSNAEVASADNIAVDLPTGWISIPQQSRAALRLRFSAEPVEVTLQAQLMPAVGPQKLEELARHLQATGATLHDAEVKKAGHTTTEVKTSIQAMPDGWRLIMSGRDSSPRQFVQVTLITSKSMKMLYAQSVAVGIEKLLTMTQDVEKGLRPDS